MLLNNLNMRRVVILLVLSVFLINVGNAQDKRKLTRKERKELREKLKEEKIKFVDSIIEQRKFVLEADYIMNRKGESFSVSSNINFIYIDSATAVFQFGSTYLIGVNGVGGVTVEGKIKDYQLTKRKSGSYYIRISVSSSIGFFDINLNITSTGVADADISTMSNKKINYSGRIKSLSQSNVYQGRSY